jgi:hypothetical protein
MASNVNPAANLISKEDKKEDKEESKDRWFQFNDTLVSYFNPQDIPNETYGGENENWETDMKQYANDQAMQ